MFKRIVIAVSMFTVGLLVGVMLWRIATVDTCPHYYNMTCLPKE